MERQNEMFCAFREEKGMVIIMNSIMNSITICSRPDEAHPAYSAFSKAIYTPVYMDRLGKTHFLWNVSSDEDPHEAREREKREIELRENGGAWFRFYGGAVKCGTPDIEWLGPVQWAVWVAGNGLHYRSSFLHENGLPLAKAENQTFFEFSGNLEEVSASFHYRIYDPQIAEKITDILLGNEVKE
jgi:hypothetical protein